MTTQSPEVVLRPSPQQSPFRYIVRTSRIRATPTSLTYQPSVGRIQRWTQGDVGWPVSACIRRVGSTEAPATPLDEVVLIDRQGRPVLSIPVADWLPVFPVLDLKEARPADPLVISGISALLDVIGLAEPTLGTRSIGPAAVLARTEPHFPTVATPFLGLAAVGAAFGLVLGLTNSLPTWGILVGAVSIATLSAYPGALYGLAGLRECRSRRRPVASLRPVPRVPVTRRFLRDARLSVVGPDLCLTDGLGRERWLGVGRRAGMVAEIALVEGEAAGVPVQGAELRDRRDTLIIFLPADVWLGDANAVNELCAVATAAGLPVREERGVRRRSARPVSTIASSERRWVHRPWPWPRAELPIAMGALAALFAAILAETGRTDLPARLSLVLLILVATAGLLCALVLWLGGRAWLDRRVRPKAGR